MVVIYSITICLSSFLLFAIQPLFARSILPLLGGAPAVWNTVLLIYQSLLLVGYVYAYGLTSFRAFPRKQVAAHLVLIVTSLFLLPSILRHPFPPSSMGSPVPWLMVQTLAAVGIPFFVLSTTSVVLQSWWTYSEQVSAQNPYFLYQASNVGSILALLSYPIVVEPRLGLLSQYSLWAQGYRIFSVCVILCGVLIWRRARIAKTKQLILSESFDSFKSLKPLDISRVLFWIVLAFIPSSLLSSTTTQVSATLAGIPLFWVIPLVLYLLSFIVAFNNHLSQVAYRIARSLFPIVLLPVVVSILFRANQPVGLLIALHLILFFLATLLCHASLALDRPPPQHLGKYFLMVSLGGVLGGAFSGVLAPLLFSSVIEHPIGLTLATLVGLTRRSELRWPKWKDWSWAIGLTLFTYFLLATTSRVKTEIQQFAIVVPVMLAYRFSGNALRFGSCVGGILLAGLTWENFEKKGLLELQQRDFFGISRVELDSTRKFRFLGHGTTLHGTIKVAQGQEPRANHNCTPLGYYYKNSPAGLLFAHLKLTASAAVGVVGLGTGSLACYGTPKQPWTFYEIDPLVAEIAQDPRYFTFLKNTQASVRLVLGDARLSLSQEKSSKYDLIVLDAYSSDVVPVHLLTDEAVEIYLRNLTESGVLAFHISTQWINLTPVLAAHARAHNLDGILLDQRMIAKEDYAEGAMPSRWIILGRDSESIAELKKHSNWISLKNFEDQFGRMKSPWTDDFSSIFSLFHF